MFSPSSSARSNTVSPSAPLARRTLLLGGLAVLTAGCAARVHPLSEEAKRKLPAASPLRERLSLARSEHLDDPFERRDKRRDERDERRER